MQTERISLWGCIVFWTDYSVVEVLREEPARVTIRGLRRSFYPPSHLPPVDNSPPEKKLQLEWVYGYRGTDTRRNLWVLPSGELLYYVAAVAILFDREENAQRHYIGHTEDITCMEVDRSGYSNFSLENPVRRLWENPGHFGYYPIKMFRPRAVCRSETFAMCIADLVSGYSTSHALRDGNKWGPRYSEKWSFSRIDVVCIWRVNYPFNNSF